MFKKFPGYCIFGHLRAFILYTKYTPEDGKKVWFNEERKRLIVFIHIGNDNVIRSQEIVAIIDYDLYTNASGMYQMIQEWKQQKKVSGPEKTAKSIMVTENHIFFSSLSVTTLRKRSGILTTISNLEDYYEE